MINEKWLIDVNEFRKIFWSKLQDLRFVGPMDVEHIILNTPKVDAVEIAHGHWIQDEEYHICSVCNNPVIMNRLSPDKWCKNCGAKMDGGK